MPILYAVLNGLTCRPAVCSSHPAAANAWQPGPAGPPPPPLAAMEPAMTLGRAAPPPRVHVPGSHRARMEERERRTAAGRAAGQNPFAEQERLFAQHLRQAGQHQLHMLHAQAVGPEVDQGRDQGQNEPWPAEGGAGQSAPEPPREAEAEGWRREAAAAMQQQIFFGPPPGGPGGAGWGPAGLSELDEQAIMAQIIRHIQEGPQPSPPSRAAARAAVAGLARGVCGPCGGAGAGAGAGEAVDRGEGEEEGEACAVCMEGFEAGQVHPHRSSGLRARAIISGPASSRLASPHPASSRFISPRLAITPPRLAEAELRARWRPDRNSAALAACACAAGRAGARQAQASPGKHTRAQTPSPRAGAGAAACWAASGCMDG
jgi:hypothetical protein